MGENKSSREKACFDRTPSVYFHLRMFAYRALVHKSRKRSNRTLLVERQLVCQRLIGCGSLTWKNRGQATPFSSPRRRRGFFLVATLFFGCS
jgi:hypothetical protein